MEPRPIERAGASLFRRLAVFVGGWTLEAAEGVCAIPIRSLDAANEAPNLPEHGAPVLGDADVLNLRGQLVDKSLVQLDVRVGEMRYRLLETIREYAWERMIGAGEENLARDCHRNWYLTFAEDAELELWGARQPEIVETLDSEQGNLWTALAWCVEHDLDAAARMASCLFWYWAFQSRWLELGRWFEALLMHPPTDEHARAKVLLCKGLSLRADDPEQSVAVIQESLDWFRSHGDWRRCGWALNNLGIVAAIRGDHVEAKGLLEEGLTCFRTFGDQPRVGTALRDLGLAAELAGDHERADTNLFQSLAVLQQVDDCWNLATTLR